MHIKLNSVIGSTVLFASLLGSVSAFAYDGHDFYYRERRREDHRQFALGVCVGQVLAQEGVTLPAPQPGQRQDQAPDSSTQSALRAAEQTCRAQMDGSSATPTPSPSSNPTATLVVPPTLDPGATTNTGAQ